ncbi:methyl-accepting chemotaxis protein [Aliikangiella maris]|uniref:Methyl-accepting chemotaxis protein n=2 Tax=Aliikangiella maris TaxID=3162458 RepID=A0ABV2BU03_9GAMM
MINKWLGNLKLTYKFGLAFCMLILPLILTVYLLASDSFHEVDILKKEIKGVDSLKPLHTLSQKIALHRGTSAGAISGDENMRSRLKTIEGEVKNGFVQVYNNLNESFGAELSAEAKSLEQRWNQLVNDNLRLSLAESVRRHSDIIHDVNILIKNMANDSNLVLDERLDTYHMISAVVDETPSMANQLGLIRAVGTNVLVSNSIDSKQRLTITRLIVSVFSSYEKLKRNREIIFEANPSLAGSLSNSYNELIEALEKADRLVEEKILQPEMLSYSSIEYFDEMTAITQKIFAFNDAILPNLKAEIESRASAEENATLAQMFLVLLIVALGLAMAIIIVRQSIKKVHVAVDVFEEIGKGKLNNEIDDTDKDEFGQLFTALTDMQTGLRNKEEEIGRLVCAIEGMTTNMMMADPDGVINYLNPSVEKMLRSREKEIQKTLPNFAIDTLIGTSFDAFHKNPAHQRNMLKPENLPYKASIQVGKLSFDLTAVALKNTKGEYLGTAVEWLDTTSEQENKQEIGRLVSAIEGMTTNLMMADPNGVINYINPSIKKMLSSREKEIQKVLPNFSIDTLIGTSFDAFHKNPAHQRNVLKPENLPYKANIQVGNLHFELTAVALHSTDGEYLGTAVEWVDTTNQQESKREIGRLVSATQGMTTNLMMADTDGVINYMNPAVKRMLKRREKELQKSLPNFAVDKVIGSSFDEFHKNPAHQRNVLKPENLPYKASIKVGPLTFELTAVALADSDGNYLGTAVEWIDMTDITSAQEMIESLISEASRGNLSSRLEADSYEGFMRNLALGINSMLDTVVEPIESCKDVLESMAAGNLQDSMDGTYHGLFNQLQTSINTSIDNLRNMVGEIMETSSHVSTSAKEISQGNTDLSQRTEEQASSLEETASSMEELTGTVKENAEAANNANQLSIDTMKLAESGGKVVTEAIDAMKEINSASKEISDIIVVIDEIAFQTNLLALNAAVEAARAGDQGRGFAVVAAEVRNLAQRSASAAKDIKSLINNSVSKVEQGSQLVNDSGKKLTDIVDSVRRVTQLVKEISNASEEQSSGIEQINQAIAQMDNMTQQNSALVEEAAASAESLSEQAGNLMELMSFFKTGEESGRRSEEIVSPVKRKLAHKDEPMEKTAMQTDQEWEEF